MGKKYLSVFISVLLMMCIFGCATKQEVHDYKNAVLILEQYPSENSDSRKQGIVYAQCIMTWKDDQVDTVQMSATFENEEQAKTIHASIVAEGVNTWREGKVVNYFLSPDVWRSQKTSYLEAVEYYKNDPDQVWSIKETAK